MELGVKCSCECHTTIAVTNELPAQGPTHEGYIFRFEIELESMSQVVEHSKDKDATVVCILLLWTCHLQTLPIRLTLFIKGEQPFIQAL